MMISYTNQDLQNRTSEIQQIANRRPVLIENDGLKQVLLSYDDYKKLAGADADKPFLSLGDMLGHTPAADVDFDEEADMSLLERL